LTRTVRLGLCILALLSLTVACGGGGGEPSASSSSTRLTMNVGVQSVILQTYYPELAQSLGFFDDENLDAKITVGDSTATAVQALLGGSLDVYVGGPEGLAANEQGADVRFVAAAANRSIWNVVAAPGISDIKQLQGANVGVSALQSISTVTTRQALRAQGVDPSTLTLVTAGGTSRRYAALQAGQVKAAPLGIPVNYQASQSKGFKDFGSTNELGAPPIASVVVAVSKKWANAHPEQMQRFLRAYQRTIDALYDPSQQQRVVDILSKGLKVEPPYVERALQDMFRSGPEAGQVMPRDAHIDKGALQTAADAMLEFGGLKARVDVSTAIDQSYLEKAQASLRTAPPPPR
jgi:ABC-type nitrate/sulfonate/bicarbonate transport system substrate-binding protein